MYGPRFVVRLFTTFPGSSEVFEEDEDLFIGLLCTKNPFLHQLTPVGLYIRTKKLLQACKNNTWTSLRKVANMK